MRQLAANPWDALHEKYPVGATVEGRVRNLTDFGAFIEIEDGIDGLVHVSNLSWTKRVKHPSEVLKKGDRVKAVVLAIEPDKRRLSLGVKQLQPDVWETFFAAASRRRRGARQSAARGQLRRIRRNRRRRRRPLPQLRSRGRATASRCTLEPGMEHDFKIIKMNPEEKKVGLSIKAVGEEASRSEVEAYKQPVSSTRRLHHRRADVVEARRRRKQLGEFGGHSGPPNWKYYQGRSHKSGLLILSATAAAQIAPNPVPMLPHPTAHGPAT